MRKTLTSTAAAAVAGLLLVAGPTAHASPTAQAAPAAKGKTLAAAAWRAAAPAAHASPTALAAWRGTLADTPPLWWPPSSMRHLVTDLRAVLHHAGFRLTAAVGGKPPAQVRYIQSFSRLSFLAPSDVLLARQVGRDPVYSYLATELSHWGGEHPSGALWWTWYDPSAAESVRLMYWHAGPVAGGHLVRHPRAELIIIHYTSRITQAAGGQVPTSSGRIATLLERALHRAGFARVSDRRLIAADGRLLKDVRRYALAGACSSPFYLPSALPDPRVTITRGPTWGTVSWRARGGEVALHFDTSRCPAGPWRAQLTILKNAGR